MSKKRFDNLSTERKERLFDCAAEEFSAHGFEGASLNRILRQSGMSKSSLYYYFEDKSDLFVSLVERSIGFLLRELGDFDPQQLTAEDYWPAIEARARAATEVMNRRIWYVKLARMVIRMRGGPRGHERTARLYRAVERFVAGTIGRGQELGVVRSDLPMPLLVHSAMALGEALDTWLVGHWDEMSPDERVDMVSTNVKLIRRLLVPADEP